MGRTKVTSVKSGDICAIIGIEGFEIGETVADVNEPEPLPTIAIDEPTMSMLFTINNSPFFGKDGKYVTSRHIHDRLIRELDKNLALRVQPTDSADSWLVYGRGVLHLSVLIETMRREGYELQVGQPQVIIKEINGEKCDPIEQLTINLPEECASRIIDMVTKRKGEMTMMESKNDRMHLEFTIPSRGIIGLNNAVLTASAGEAIMAHRFLEFQPWKGDIERRVNGSIIAMETGTAYAYALNNLQSRGRFFIAPGEEVYAGQVVEQGTVFEIFDNPVHPYTRMLMQALPRKPKREGRLKTIEGAVPRLTDTDPKCRFSNRCPFSVKGLCDCQDPPEQNLDGTHSYYCHLQEGELKWENL